MIAKSNVILDIKPWDDETDMAAMEVLVRGITMDGLLWGACEYRRSLGGHSGHQGCKLRSLGLQIALTRAADCGH